MQQIWTMIHESYGNDLDMTTDEEDNYHKESINSTPDKSLTKQINKNQIYDVRFLLFHRHFIFIYYQR